MTSPLRFLFEEVTIDNSSLFETAKAILTQKQVFACIAFIHMTFRSPSCPIMLKAVYFELIADVLLTSEIHIHALMSYSLYQDIWMAHQNILNLCPFGMLHFNLFCPSILLLIFFQSVDHKTNWLFVAHILSLSLMVYNHDFIRSFDLSKN